MSSYRMIPLAMVAAVLYGGGAAAQARSTAAMLVATIPAVTNLHTEPGARVESAGSGYTEVRAAVVVRVDANCGWRLVAEVPQGESAVLVRVTAKDDRASADQTGFAALASGQMSVARGGGGRSIELLIDYRVPVGTALPPVTYRVERA